MKDKLIKMEINQVVENKYLKMDKYMKVTGPKVIRKEKED